MAYFYVKFNSNVTINSIIKLGDKRVTVTGINELYKVSKRLPSEDTIRKEALDQNINYIIYYYDIIRKNGRRIM